MGVGSCWGLLAPAAKGKCLLDPNSWYRDKRSLDGGEGAPPKLLKAYMDEVVWPHPPRPNGKASMGIGPI
jgi:hypothetical protein